MPTETLASLSDMLVLLTVLSYVAAAALLGVELAYQVVWSGRAGVAVTVAGLGLNLAAATTRGLATGRVPWGNMYEYSVMLGAMIATGYLVWVARRPEVRPLGAFALLPVVAVIGVGGVALHVPAGPLVPALNSGWIRIHVAAAIIGSSVLILASVFSILYLVKDRVERRQAQASQPLVAGGARTADHVAVRESLAAQVEVQEAELREPRPSAARRLWDRVPAARTLDELAYKTTIFGFPIWTFAIIAGAIWGQSAWGRYWGWDPKETWSFIIWVVFAAYLHARSTAGWRGHRAAWLAVAGLVAFAINFYVVNVWVVGLHSYA